jgi:hypothetical protein
MKHIEPKVKNKSSFSILFLRDDSSVVRFRLKPVWVKFFVVFLVLFSISSGMAGYAAHYYWKKYNTLRLEQSRLTATLDKNRRKLDEFAGMERVEAALPRSSMSSVGVAAVNGGNGSKPQATASGDGEAGQTSSHLGSPAGSGQQIETPGSGTSQPAAPSGIGGNGQTTSAPAPQPDTRTAADPPEKKEHPALIDEVQVLPSGAKRYNLSFGLSNRDKQIRLNGRVTVSITDKGGKRYEIAQINRDSLRFVINHYKKVVTAFSLPPELDAADASRMNLTVTAEDVPDITYSFPMPLPAAPSEEVAANPAQ